MILEFYFIENLWISEIGYNFYTVLNVPNINNSFMYLCLNSHNWNYMASFFLERVPDGKFFWLNVFDNLVRNYPRVPLEAFNQDFIYSITEHLYWFRKAYRIATIHPFVITHFLEKTSNCIVNNSIMDVSILNGYSLFDFNFLYNDYFNNLYIGPHTQFMEGIRLGSNIDGLFYKVNARSLLLFLLNNPIVHDVYDEIENILILFHILVDIPLNLWSTIIPLNYFGGYYHLLVFGGLNSLNSVLLFIYSILFLLINCLAIFVIYIYIHLWFFLIIYGNIYIGANFFSIFFRILFIKCSTIRFNGRCIREFWDIGKLYLYIGVFRLAIDLNMMIVAYFNKLGFFIVYRGVYLSTYYLYRYLVYCFGILSGGIYFTFGVVIYPFLYIFINTYRYHSFYFTKIGYFLWFAMRGDEKSFDVYLDYLFEKRRFVIFGILRRISVFVVYYAVFVWSFVFLRKNQFFDWLPLIINNISSNTYIIKASRELDSDWKSFFKISKLQRLAIYTLGFKIFFFKSYILIFRKINFLNRILLYLAYLNLLYYKALLRVFIVIFLFAKFLYKTFYIKLYNVVTASFSRVNRYFIGTILNIFYLCILSIYFLFSKVILWLFIIIFNFGWYLCCLLLWIFWNPVKYMIFSRYYNRGPQNSAMIIINNGSHILTSLFRIFGNLVKLGFYVLVLYIFTVFFLGFINIDFQSTFDIYELELFVYLYWVYKFILYSIFLPIYEFIPSEFLFRVPRLWDRWFQFYTGRPINGYHPYFMTWKPISILNYELHYGGDLSIFRTRFVDYYISGKKEHSRYLPMGIYFILYDKIRDLHSMATWYCFSYNGSFLYHYYYGLMGRILKLTFRHWYRFGDIFFLAYMIAYVWYYIEVFIIPVLEKNFVVILFIYYLTLVKFFLSLYLHLILKVYSKYLLLFLFSFTKNFYFYFIDYSFIVNNGYSGDGSIGLATIKYYIYRNPLDLDGEYIFNLFYSKVSNIYYHIIFYLKLSFIVIKHIYIYIQFLFLKIKLFMWTDAIVPLSIKIGLLKIEYFCNNVYDIILFYIDFICSFLCKIVEYTRGCLNGEILSINKLFLLFQYFYFGLLACTNYFNNYFNLIGDLFNDSAFHSRYSTLTQENLFLYWRYGYWDTIDWDPSDYSLFMANGLNDGTSLINILSSSLFIPTLYNFTILELHVFVINLFLYNLFVFIFIYILFFIFLNRGINKLFNTGDLDSDINNNLILFRLYPILANSLNFYGESLYKFSVLFTGFYRFFYMGNNLINNYFIYTDTKSENVFEKHKEFFKFEINPDELKEFYSAESITYGEPFKAEFLDGKVRTNIDETLGNPEFFKVFDDYIHNIFVSIRVGFNEDYSIFIDELDDIIIFLYKYIRLNPNEPLLRKKTYQDFTKIQLNLDSSGITLEQFNMALYSNLSKYRKRFDKRYYRILEFILKENFFLIKEAIWLNYLEKKGLLGNRSSFFKRLYMRKVSPTIHVIIKWIFEFFDLRSILYKFFHIDNWFNRIKINEDLDFEEKMVKIEEREKFEEFDEELEEIYEPNMDVEFMDIYGDRGRVLNTEYRDLDSIEDPWASMSHQSFTGFGFYNNETLVNEEYNEYNELTMFDISSDMLFNLFNIFHLDGQIYIKLFWCFYDYKDHRSLLFFDNLDYLSKDITLNFFRTMLEKVQIENKIWSSFFWLEYIYFGNLVNCQNKYGRYGNVSTWLKGINSDLFSTYDFFFGSRDSSISSEGPYLFLWRYPQLLTEILSSLVSELDLSPLKDIQKLSIKGQFDKSFGSRVYIEPLIERNLKYYGYKEYLNATKYYGDYGRGYTEQTWDPNIDNMERMGKSKEYRFDYDSSALAESCRLGNDKLLNNYNMERLDFIASLFEKFSLSEYTLLKNVGLKTMSYPLDVYLTKSIATRLLEDNIYFDMKYFNRTFSIYKTLDLWGGFRFYEPFLKTYGHSQDFVDSFLAHGVVYDVGSEIKDGADYDYHFRLRRLKFMLDDTLGMGSSKVHFVFNMDPTPRKLSTFEYFLFWFPFFFLVIYICPEILGGFGETGDSTWELLFYIVSYLGNLDIYFDLMNSVWGTLFISLENLSFRNPYSYQWHNQVISGLRVRNWFSANYNPYYYSYLSNSFSSTQFINSYIDEYAYNNSYIGVMLDCIGGDILPYYKNIYIRWSYVDFECIHIYRICSYGTLYVSLFSLRAKILGILLLLILMRLLIRFILRSKLSKFLIIKNLY